MARSAAELLLVSCIMGGPCCGVYLQDYPEHRLQFFNLLHAITKHCFATLFTMSPTQLKLVIDSIIWFD